MKEHNLFELIGRFIARLRRAFYRHQTSSCPKSRAGHHSVRLLWHRYTLTDTELIARGLWTTRRADLQTLRVQSRMIKPEIRPGKYIRFTVDGAEELILRRLHYMAGGVHFIMLLGKATGLDLIGPFLGTEEDSSSANSSDL